MDSDCIEWQGNLGSGGGYGRISVNGKHYQAHRWIWTLEHGDIPDGMCICHHCDNPSCVNPDHLFMGTHQDNMQDMIDKGKHAVINRAKLSEDDVRECRKLREGGMTNTDIAKIYDVSRQTISRAVRGIHWRNIK